MKPVINIDAIELEPRPQAFLPPHGTEKFDARLGDIGQHLGMRKLGCNITAIAPGKRAFPFHNHHVNDEIFLVLEGSGELRLGDEVHGVRQGDVVCCPAGGPETAHQFVNTGDVELRFLAISSMSSPEICEYPDSGKFAISALVCDGNDKRTFRYAGREAASLDYWDGE